LRAKAVIADETAPKRKAATHCKQNSKLKYFKIIKTLQPATGVEEHEIEPFTPPNKRAQVFFPVMRCYKVLYVVYCILFDHMVLAFNWNDRLYTSFIGKTLV
jgi:hypothetical protein